MKKLNIDFLIENPIQIENLDNIFKNLLQEIKLYLGLELVNTYVKILFEDRIINSKFYVNKIINIGVERTFQDGNLQLIIFKDYEKFIPIILLREAYYCFIPDDLKYNDIISIFINQKVESDLKKLSNIKEWKVITREKLVNFEFISAEFNRLENFLKRESTETTESPFKYFFRYIRRNIQIIGEKKNHFYDILFKEYVAIDSNSLYNDEIIETLRVLVKIFYDIRSYNALLDYQHHFTEFKKRDLIDTGLSLKKFTENMQWIKKFSNLSPNYKVNWPALNIHPIYCSLKFNPLLKRVNVDQILNELPFFVIIKKFKNSFNIEVDGFFVLPNIYFNDLVIFLEKLEMHGYLIQKNWFITERNSFFVNLNYFREFAKNRILIDNTIKHYENKYEMDFGIIYGQEKYKSKMSLLDWLLIDRVRYYSVTGFGFERRAENLKFLKDDLINEILSQRYLIKNLKFSSEVINSNSELKNSFLIFLETNSSFGFFYIKKMLHNYVSILELIETFFTKHDSVNTINNFLDFTKKYGITYSIEKNLLLKNKSIKKIIVRDSLPLYFKSKKIFEKEIEKYQIFYNFLNSCSGLKIFNINNIKAIINKKSILNIIYKSKEEKLEKSYESYKLYEITNKLIENKIDNFVNNKPNIIEPILLNTIQFTIKSSFIMLLKNNHDTIKNLEKLKVIAKKMVISQGKLLYIELLLPYLNWREKSELISILFNIFKNNIISIKRYFWSGIAEAYSRKDFYDLEKEEFFYTKDLFEQYFLNVKKTLGDCEKPLPEALNKINKKFWAKGKDINNLVKQAENRKRSENIDLNIINLHKILKFHRKLEDHLLNIERYKKTKEEYFFKNYIKSINFIPSFQNFGISQYFLYFYPTDINQIDFKLLMNNSFQSISYPAQIDNSNSFLFQYIFPFRNPGIATYLNWLTKSKKIVREYCLFFVKKAYQILHFNYNLSSDGWDLDPNRFKIYFQNILFNPDYKVQIPAIKEFNMGDLNVSDYYGPDSLEFKMLSQIYNRKSLDIKSYLTRRYFKIIGNITELLNKDLIHPYISVKNIDLIEEITIILPNVKQELNETLIKIFSFFNVGFIYEVEGEYYIHGFEEVIKFENGMMIKLRLPDCQLDEFENLFDLIFEYLEIDHYLVLNDLVDGENLIQSTFKELKFLEAYNPLTNLIWNDKDKKWRNHKLFNEKFEPFYPDLFYGKDKYNL